MPFRENERSSEPGAAHAERGKARSRKRVTAIGGSRRRKARRVTANPLRVHSSCRDRAPQEGATSSYRLVAVPERSNLDPRPRSHRAIKNAAIAVINGNR